MFGTGWLATFEAVGEAEFWKQTAIFLSLTLRGLGVALVLGLPLGILLTRLPRISGPVIAVLGVLQTIPSLALLALLIPFLGIGQPAAIFAAVIYSLFPIVLNTHVGITQVPPAIRDAARGMGMTGGQVLWNVELPMAFPVILAGVRTGAVYAISIITVCSLAGAGGLGDYITTGLTRGDDGLIYLGAVPILIITLVMFWGLSGLAWLARQNSAHGLLFGGTMIAALSLYALFAAVSPLFWRHQVDVRIGSKNFTEGRILSEILKQMLEAHTGLTVEMVPNLGSNLAYKSILNDEIDLYPEYTGNLLTGKDALDMKVPANKLIITKLVREQMRKRFNLVFLDTFGLNNTYVLCVPRALAEQRNLRRISDLQHAPHLRVVVDLEFKKRPDGWNGLVKAYDLHFQNEPRQVSPDLRYRAMKSREADVVLGFATDWEIEDLDLVMLEDDKSYFPNYHGAPLLRGDVLARHPEIAEVLNRLKDQIDDRTMRLLNAQVARDQRPEAKVAREFLIQRGLLGQAKSGASK
jgi:osmoprotectant transport system permease protein